jgi:hypothetical protein
MSKPRLELLIQRPEQKPEPSVREEKVPLDKVDKVSLTSPRGDDKTTLRKTESPRSESPRSESPRIREIKDGETKLEEVKQGGYLERKNSAGSSTPRRDSKGRMKLFFSETVDSVNKVVSPRPDGKRY